MVLTRRAFRVNSGAATIQAVLRVDYDDGFVAYLNGKRVASAHAPPGKLTASSRATASHEANGYSSFQVPEGLLRNGRNVLAVAGLNVNGRSTDMTLQAELGTVANDLHAKLRMRKSGGELLLTASDGETFERLVIPPQVADHSYGRLARTSAWGFFLTPTPGTVNHDVSFEHSLADDVQCKAPSGPYSEPFRVLLKSSLDEKRVIRYTTNGSKPTAGSRSYDAPLWLKSDAVLRAATFVGEERASPVFSKSFLFGKRPSLPVFSLAMEPGEYAQVHNNAHGRGRESERLAFLEVIEPNGKIAAAGAVGIRLHGGGGRVGDFARKKSYRLYFRGAYGQARLDYPLFGEGGPAIEKIVPRAGLDDSFFTDEGFRSRATYLRDELIRALHRDMGGLAARGAWCEIYVNARPRGLYNLVDRIDEEFLTAHLGVEGPWDIVKTHDKVAAGDGKEWERVVDMARRGLEREASYREFGKAVDIDAFTDYVILNLWAQNHDWPSNNWYAARRRVKGGKWFFLCWDAEFSVGLEPTGYRHDLLRRALWGRGFLKHLFTGLWRNSAYRQTFRRRVQAHLRLSLAPAAVVAHIERLATAIRPAIQGESQRYGSSGRRWQDNVAAMKEFARRRGEVFTGQVENSVARRR